MARFAVKIDGKERIVEIDAGAKPRVDGVEVDVAVVAAEPGSWILRQGSEQTVAIVDGTNGKMTVELRRPGADSLIIPAEVADARRAKIAAPARETGGAAPVTLRAPLPGRVVKLLVKPGDDVTAGQTLVVMEATNTENELRAPRAGRVADVRCAEGAAVEAGQDLATIV